MVKLCKVCGGVIEADDWYSYIRMKYCPECAKTMRRIQEAERLRKLREEKRREHALLRELCASQQAEIELLRAELLRQRERTAALKRERMEQE